MPRPAPPALLGTPPAIPHQSPADKPSVMCRYAAYGLTFSSAIPIPDVPVVDGVPDVQIVTGPVPQTLDGATASGPGWWTTDQQTLVSIAGIGRYLVEGGERITVDAASTADPSEIVLGLTGGAFGPLLHQRGQFLLHAASVSFRGRTLACAGHSGSGKSTLVLALISHGATMLSDDLTPLTIDATTGSVLTARGVAAVNAWSDALAHLGLSPADATPVRKTLPKFRFSVPSWPTPRLPLDAVVVLTGKRREGPLSVQGPLEGTRAFATLRSVTRGLRIAEAIQGPVRLMTTVSAVASRVPVYTLDRGPLGLDGLDDMVAAMSGAVPQ